MQASGWEPEHNEQDMLRLLHLLRDVACGLKLLQTQQIVHADLVRQWWQCWQCGWLSHMSPSIACLLCLK